ncbi:hypothetical protein J4526_01470 [Desulfurococcaceae archaeon MEX13E-LK6-19]|nr:hypothetical protein J4526_01470 [Desulfurococcaceae archaeon MEX13E-LK6-19]
MKKPNMILLMYILVLQLLDLLTTYLAISHGARELNPLVTPTIENPIAFLTVKLVAAAVVYLGVLKTKNKTLLLAYTIIMVQTVIANMLNTIL